ncbi:MAG: DUF1259 domain-containing protein [Gemmatimonadota bacterium]
MQQDAILPAVAKGGTGIGSAVTGSPSSQHKEEPEMIIRASPLVTVLSCIALALPVAASSQNVDPWIAVGRTLGTENVSSAPYHRYNLPRSDLTLTIAGVDASAIGLGAWVGFSGEPNDATMMGDLVVTSAELGPVLEELARQRIAVTAIHNHFAGETPQIVYMHFHGQGVATDLASRVERAVALTGTPRPAPAPRPQPVQIDTALVFRVLGQSGSASGPVARLSFQLVDGAVTMDGRVVNPALGYGSPIVIQQVNANRAVATGDFAVRGRAVTPLLRALAEGGTVATAVHSHLIDSDPDITYIHFWGDGPLNDVLRGLRSALDAGR